MSSVVLFRRASVGLLVMACVSAAVRGQTGSNAGPGPKDPPRAKAKAKEKEKAKTNAKATAKPANAKAEAEVAKPADDPTRAASPAPGGFLGDTKKFTRMGGWGSMGGTIGQFGMARSALITMPPVQEELKLTNEQKERIREWLEGMRKRGEEMGRAMREPAPQRGPGEEPGQPAEVPIAARIFQFTNMLNQIGEMVREQEGGLGRILKADQRKRLSQIALQMEGAAAVLRPEVAEAINLGPDQAELIQQTLAQARLMQMATWIEQGRAMANLRGDRRRPDAPGGDQPTDAPGDASGQRRAAPAPSKGQAERPADPNDPRPTDAEGRRPPRDPEREKAFRKQFETMRERSDSIQERTAREILKVLTRRQRASFDRLLGPPFDPAKINTLGPPGSRPRPPSDTAPKPDAG